MHAGLLRARIAIDAPVLTQSATGGAPGTWTELVSGLAAGITPLSGREKEIAAAISTDISHEILIRYEDRWADPVVMATYRIRYGARRFNIIAAITVDERRHWITISASEGAVRGTGA